MSTHHYGQTSGVLNLLPGYPTKDRDGSKWSVTYGYWCGADVVTSLIPAAFAACPLSGFTTLTLQKTTISDAKSGIVNVLLVYSSPDGFSSIPEPTASTTTQEAETVIVEVPLLSPSGYPNIKLMTYLGVLSDSMLTMAAAGAGTKAVPHVRYRFTDYTASFTWSESALCSNIGKRASAGAAIPSLSVTSNDNWLYTRVAVRQVGASLTERTREWEQDPLGWDTTLYLAGS